MKRPTISETKVTKRTVEITMDILSTSLWITLVWCAFVVLFAPNAQAGDLNHNPADVEFQAASESAAKELAAVRQAFIDDVRDRLEQEFETMIAGSNITSSQNADEQLEPLKSPFEDRVQIEMVLAPTPVTIQDRLIED